MPDTKQINDVAVKGEMIASSLLVGERAVDAAMKIPHQTDSSPT